MRFLSEPLVLDSKDEMIGRYWPSDITVVGVRIDLDVDLPSPL